MNLPITTPYRQIRSVDERGGCRMYRGSVASSRSRGSIGSFNSLALLSGTGKKLKINKIIGATFHSCLNSKLSHKNSDSSAPPLCRIFLQFVRRVERFCACVKTKQAIPATFCLTCFLFPPHSISSVFRNIDRHATHRKLTRR